MSAEKKKEVKKVAKLTIPSGVGTEKEVTVELPVHFGTLGEPVLDISSLYSKAKVFTHDPGFSATSSCESKITFIDGDKGVLLHGGYSIEDLAEKSDFMDVSYLVMFGELPSAQQKSEHIRIIKSHTMVHEKVRLFFNGFEASSHPMAIMCGVVGSMSAFYHDELNVYNVDDQLRAAYRLVSKMPTIAAMAYKTSIGLPMMYPRNDLSFAENFLYMLFAVPTEPYHVKPIMVKAIDTLLILHADHEQNASTSAVRVAGSSGANPYAAVASGIAALWGPAHGGANEAVLEMLQTIGSVENIPKYIAMAKDKNSQFRLMGFGHRVYKNYDPRATVIKKICHQLMSELQINNPLLTLAMELEKIALSDPYFIEKKLFPNVDFYSGIVLTALGIPVSMFTVFFAVGRTVGWISQWMEMMRNPHHKISRPRQLYVGQPRRDYIPVAQRVDSKPLFSHAQFAKKKAAKL